MNLLFVLLHSGGSVSSESGTYWAPYYIGGGILVFLIVLIMALLSFGQGREHS